MQGAQVWFLVKELDSCMLQLKMEDPVFHNQCSQIKTVFKEVSNAEVSVEPDFENYFHNVLLVTN